MRQGNGTDLLGMNDPRSATIGVIYVSSNDDRKSVLAAILTQEKLGRKDIVIVLPDANKAFQSSQDFDDLKSVDRKLQAKIIFVASDVSADYAHQRQFPVFPTLEGYTQSLNENNTDDNNAAPEKKRSFFGGRKSKPLNGGGAAIGGAIVGAAAASALSKAEQPDPQESSQQANADAPRSGPEGQRSQRGRGAAQQSPRQGSSAGNTIDDDDAIDDTPSVPVRRGAGAGAAGAAMGYGAAETLRRNQNNPARANAGASMQTAQNNSNLDAAGPTRNVLATSETPAAAAVSARELSMQSATPPATPTTNAPESVPGESESGPGIIDLPVRGRNTINLQERANAAAPSQAAQLPEPPAPPSRGATKRRNSGNGGVATAAGLAGGAMLGVTNSANATHGAPTTASGGKMLPLLLGLALRVRLAADQLPRVVPL